MKVIRVLVCVLTTAAIAAAQTDQTKLAAAFSDVDRIFNDYVTQTHVPGAVWGIVVDGTLAHTGAAGYRDVAAKAPVDADTVFRIASMTKSFTAMSILKLRDEGKLSGRSCAGCPSTASA